LIETPFLPTLKPEEPFKIQERDRRPRVDSAGQLTIPSLCLRLFDLDASEFQDVVTLHERGALNLEGLRLCFSILERRVRLAIGGSFDRRRFSFCDRNLLLLFRLDCF
jgi:hypothetical protein